MMTVGAERREAEPPTLVDLPARRCRSPRSTPACAPRSGGNRRRARRSAWRCRRLTDERPRSLHVLVAEDNRTNQKVIGKILEHAGHRATIVATGQEAVEALEEPGYDLVLMDLNMPELGGIEAVKLLALHPRCRRAATDRGAERRRDAADARGLPDGGLLRLFDQAGRHAAAAADAGRADRRTTGKRRSANADRQLECAEPAPSPDGGR